MSRYTGPTWKVSRRLGYSILETGVELKKRAYGPGPHAKDKKKKPSKHVCAECGAVLHGVPRGRPYEIAKLAKSQKRPNRPFGGYLCPKCARKHFKDEARK